MNLTQKMKMRQNLDNLVKVKTQKIWDLNRIQIDNPKYLDHHRIIKKWLIHSVIKVIHLTKLKIILKSKNSIKLILSLMNKNKF